MSETVYRCPLCLSDAARVSDELIWRRNDDGSITVETLMGRALRVEALLEDHMARVHDLTPEEAVEALSVGQV